MINKIANKIMLKKEQELCNKLKSMMDTTANFVKPLSEFYKGTEFENKVFGLWCSGEGKSCIDEIPIADYYNNYNGINELKLFMKKYNLYLDWYDPGTIFIYFK